MEDKESKSSIFRKKNLDKVSGPESLNDYIRVTSPSVWIALLAILILLAGMLVWSIFGKITVHHEDGSVEEVHPITYVIN